MFQKPDRIYGIALLLTAVAAWCSVGFHHPDEHFQVLEFCNYKLGFSPASHLPWEYGVRCRSGILPFMAWVVARLLLLVHLYDPVILAFLLRLGAGIASVAVAKAVIGQWGGLLKYPIVQKYYGYAAYFLWFVPYINVRFSAETVSSVLFFAFYLLVMQPFAGKKGVWGHLLAGFLAVCVLFIRLQFAFAFLPIAFVLLFRNKTPLAGWGSLIAGAIVAVGCCTAIDYWLYGCYTCTPYNYFDQNILQNKAAGFGTMPAWWYITEFIGKGVPPISIGLLVLYVLGTAKQIKHPLAQITLFFILGHCAIGHKEMRFLYPVLPSFLWCCFAGLDYVLQTYNANKPVLTTLKVFTWLNMALLCFRSLTPAHERIAYYCFIDQYSRTHPTTVVGIGQSPYFLDVIELNFYKRKGIAIATLNTEQQLDSLYRQHPARPYLYISHTAPLDRSWQGFKGERLYSLFPNFILQNNFNHWQERSDIWAVYRLVK